MTARQQGGARTPARPAAVSGPGALSQRTDGGPGAKSQPVRVASGGAYGERAAAEAQQSAAPMAAGGTPTGGAGGAPAAGGAPPLDPAGVFGPTQMPGQSIMTGVPGAPTQQAPDSKAVLQMIYDAYPSPWIASLLSD